MMDDVAIRVRSVRKDFDVYGNHEKKVFRRRMIVKRNVLDCIDLEVRRGEILGVLGSNGCGKSTLLKIIAGIIPPTEGEVTVNGKVASILELSMGFHDDLTCIENIFVRGELYGIDDKVLKERLDDIIAYADIGDYIYSPVRMLSSGMRSRLAFAILINVDADIYIIDEALSVGDSAFNMKAGGFLKSLVTEGKTVVITAHNTYNIRSICTRAVLMEEGRIVFDGSTDEACIRYNGLDMSSEDNVRKLAESGIPKAEYRMSKICKDSGESARWLKEAAMAGHPRAMSDYGDILMGEGSAEEARRFYRLASEMDEISSKWKLAVMESSFDEKELYDTMEWMARTGDHFDRLRYGQLLYYTAKSRRDYERAFREFSQSAEDGNLEARYVVATMMLSGTGTEVNVEEGLKLLISTGEMGYVKAMNRLVQVYSDGKYVPIDMGQVFRWHLALAESGIAENQFIVATMLMKGIGTERNEEKAKEWFAKYAIASIAGPVNGAVKSSKFFPVTPKLDAYNMNNILIKGDNRFALSDNLRTMTDVYKVKNPERVFELAQQVASTSGYYQLFLADCYYRGIGTEVDLEKSFMLYRNAANSGNPTAMLMLGLMYRDGVGTEKNMTMCEKYVRMAAKRDDPVAISIVETWEEKISKKIKKIPHPRKFGKQRHEKYGMNKYPGAPGNNDFGSK